MVRLVFEQNEVAHDVNALLLSLPVKAAPDVNPISGALRIIEIFTSVRGGMICGTALD